MSRHKKIILNSLWLSLQPISLNILSLFVVGYVARTLGQELYGKFNYAFAFVAMFMPFVNLGLSSLITRHIAENLQDKDRFLGKLLSLRLILIILTAAVYYLWVFLLDYPSDSRVALQLVGLTILFNGLSITFNSAFQGIEEMKYISIVQFMSGVLLMCSSVLVLHNGYGLIGLVQVYVMGSLLSLFLYVHFANRYFKIDRIEIDLKFYLSLLKQARHLFIPNFLSTLGNKAGIILLGHITGISVVGLYTAASGLLDRLFLIPDSLCSAVFPAMSVSWKTSMENTRELFLRYYRYLCLISFPIMVGICITSGGIIQLIFGSQFIQSATILRILSLWLFCSFVNMYFGYTLIAMHREKINSRFSIITTAVYITLCLVFIPMWGMIGAGLAGVCSQGFQTLTLSYQLSKYFNVPVLADIYIIKVLISSLFMGGVVYFLNQNIFLGIITGIALYALAIFAFGLISLKDIKNLQSIFRGPIDDVAR